MCGIAGAISPNGVDLGAVPPMLDAIRHRGPDGDGYVTCTADGELRSSSMPERPRGGPACAALGHLRLSILDLAPAGDQPMVAPDGRLALIYNGEIYNYVELREELRGARPRRSASTGDTEVLLERLRASGGRSASSGLVGMWAFVLLDLRRAPAASSRATASASSRCSTRSRTAPCCFASEIKGLLAPPAVDARARRGRRAPTTC